MSLSLIKRSRSIHYDLLRIIACLLVIFTHSPIPHDGWNGAFLSGLSYFCAPCIGIFIMISGALLLNKQYAEGFDTKTFLQKRASRVVWPTVIWSIIGFTLSYLGIKNSENAILWFMFTIVGLYLLTPILYRWISSAKKQEVEFYLLFWVISLCYPYLKSIIHLNESDTSWIYYFHGFVGYFILGYYLSKYEIHRSLFVILLILFSFFSIVLPLLSYGLNLNVYFYSWFWYLSASVAFQCIIWWMFIKKISVYFYKGRSIIEFLSKHSFGIYLVHILVLRNILWKLSWIQSLSGILQVTVCLILTFTISLFISWCISKLRYGKYVVGV